MLIIGDLGLSSLVLLVSVVFPAILLVIRGKWRRSAARKQEIKRLLVLASEEAARAELEYSLRHRAISTSVSPDHRCALCYNPGTMRCAQCKAVRYCSGNCQIVHWRQGHKEECRPPKAGLIFCQKDVKQKQNLHHSDGFKRANTRSNLGDTVSREPPFLNSSGSMELHAKYSSVGVDFDAINSSESSGASFSGFSSSPNSSESSDDISLCESISSVESVKSEEHRSPRIVLGICGEDSDAENPDQPKPLSSKFASSVDSPSASINLSKLKASKNVFTDGQVECRSTNASGMGDDSMHGGYLNKPSPRPSGFWECAGDSNERSNLVLVSSSCSTTISTEVSMTDVSNGGSSLNFSFNLGENAMPSISQDPVKAINAAFPLKKPQHGSPLVSISKDKIPLFMCESSVHVDDKTTERASISKPKVEFLSSGSSQASVSSKFDASTVSRGSYHTSSTLPASYRKLDHAVGDADNNSLLEERERLPSSAPDTHSVHSASRVKSEKTDQSSMHDHTSSLAAGPLSNSKNGLKTSMWRVIDQWKGSILSKTSQVEDANAIVEKCKEKGLISYELFIQLYTWKGVELHPCGLLNCGNSCYANAVLQCLAFTPPLTSYFLQRHHSKACRKREWCFTCELESLVLKLREGKSPVSPIGIVSQLKSIGSQLATGRQEDAHEFLRYAIDKMQSVCLMESEKKRISHIEEERTLIGLTFGGYFRSKIQCTKCQGKTERREPMMDLTVEIEGDIATLEEALRQFTRTETLDGANKYRCSRCKSYEKAKKKLMVLQAPNILTIVLKRFQAGKFGKLNKSVQFPETLDLGSFMSGTTDRPKYSLYGVIVHLDVMNAAFSGHYVCYVKDTSGKWFKIDDSTVTPVELKRVLNKEAYMLFYARDLSRDLRSVIKDRLMPPNPDSKMSAMNSRNRGKSARSNCGGVNSTNCSWSSTSSRGSKSYPDLDRIQEDICSDNSSLFSSNSDEGSSSCSTASTRDSSTSFEDFSDYIFGHSPCTTSQLHSYPANVGTAGNLGGEGCSKFWNSDHVWNDCTGSSSVCCSSRQSDPETTVPENYRYGDVRYSSPLRLRRSTSN